jgi:hypothetical protein
VVFGFVLFVCYRLVFLYFVIRATRLRKRGLAALIRVDREEGRLAFEISAAAGRAGWLGAVPDQSFEPFRTRATKIFMQGHWKSEA